jgi:hypothetical protein
MSLLQEEPLVDTVAHGTQVHDGSLHVAIIIPCHNEEATIAAVVKGFFKAACGGLPSTGLKATAVRLVLWSHSRRIYRRHLVSRLMVPESGSWRLFETPRRGYPLVE